MVLVKALIRALCLFIMVIAGASAGKDIARKAIDCLAAGAFDIHPVNGAKKEQFTALATPMLFHGTPPCPLTKRPGVSKEPNAALSYLLKGG